MILLFSGKASHQHLKHLCMVNLTDYMVDLLDTMVDLFNTIVDLPDTMVELPNTTVNLPDYMVDLPDTKVDLFDTMLDLPNPYNEGNCEIMKYMRINITSISLCLTSGGVQEKEIISSFGWYYFFIKTETFMCLPFHQMC